MFKHSKVILFIWLIIVMFSSSVDNSSLDATKEDSQTSPKKQGKVFVMYAASLLKTFENDLGPAFQKETGYTYQGEGRGAIQISNMIVDGQRTPDIFVSAGTVPIMKLMNNTTPMANWLVKFGSAEMVIAYSPNSLFNNDLEKARKGEIPWYEVLSKEGFNFGRTSPEIDPKGYYMIITAELANLYYNDSGIKERILGEDRNTKQIFAEEILKTILEQSQVDAVAAYKHEAVARGLPYITLPTEINLSDLEFTDFYRKAFYTFDDSSGSGQTVFGEPIYFAVTIPETVKNLEGATSFVDFMLSTKGKDLLEKQGLKYIKPAIIQGNAEKMPLSLQNLTEHLP